MKQYFQQSQKLRSVGLSKLVVRKLKGNTVYSDARSPVTKNSKALGSRIGRGSSRCGLRNTVDSCNNSFISNFKVSKDLVSKDTVSPTGKLAAELRGTCSVVQRYQNVHRIYSKESQVYQCDFFRLMYYPPDHFVAMFRKSKPAINIRTVGHVFLNGNVLHAANNNSSIVQSLFEGNSSKYGFTKIQDVCKKLHNLFQNNPSNVPSNYAFLRRQTRITLKKCFVKEWCRLKGVEAVLESILAQPLDGGEGASWKYLDDHKRTLPGIAKDGYYSFQVLIFPDQHTKGEFEANVSRSVQEVAKLQWDVFLKSQQKAIKDEDMTWVQKANDHVSIESLNKLLRTNEVPFAVERVQDRSS